MPLEWRYTNDGVDWQELSALYRAFCDGMPSPLAALEVQYADYAAWQRSWPQGEALERQLSYWRTKLGAAPPMLELPTDRPRPPRDGANEPNARNDGGDGQSGGLQPSPASAGGEPARTAQN